MDVFVPTLFIIPPTYLMLMFVKEFELPLPDAGQTRPFDIKGMYVHVPLFSHSHKGLQYVAAQEFGNMGSVHFRSLVSSWEPVHIAYSSKSLRDLNWLFRLLLP